MQSNRLVLLALVFLAVGAVDVEAQEREGQQDAYFRAVAEFFSVSSSEISVLRDWRLTPEEVPVVLFVAERAGISGEALVTLRRSGQSWSALGERYGVGAAALYVPIPDESPAGRLSGVYEQYRSIPPGQWDGIRLSADDIVTLVNVRLLAETLGIPPEDVLRRAGAASSFVQLYGELIR